ncbi:ABC transporter ATP-binding protein [Corynebacterium frankenforstense]|uniref:ABC transporter ATP-binding protein n=1 Tax=Corynebacterium frankenforstense TaxID=1230998 RepID=UPI0026F074DB|nr:ABC transporter ATP-binding protein [Corynebacterium frankenforstense]
MRTRPFVTLLGMLAHHRGALAFAVALSLVSSVVALVQPLVVNRMIADFPDGVAGRAGILVALLAVSSVADGASIYVMTRTAESAVYDTRTRLIDRVLRLPVTAYDRLRTGDLVTRVGADTTLVRSAFTGGLVGAVGSAVTMVGSVVLMGLIDVVMLGVVLTVVALALLAVIVASGRIQRSTKAAQKSVGELGAGLERALVAVRTIRAAGARAQGRIEAALGRDARRAFGHGRDVAKVEGLLFPATGLSLQVAFLAVLGIGGMRVAAGAITVADLVSFVLYLFMLASPLGAVFGAVTTVRQAMGAIERIQRILGEPVESEAGAELEPVPGAPAVEFDRVTFSYAHTTEEGEEEIDDAARADAGGARTVVLHDVSFTVPAGTTTALVGPSGAGKSTALALIERFYSPDSGRVLVAGRDTAGLNPAALRPAIGYVEQEAAVLAGTVRENLRLVAEDATDGECWRVLEQVGLDSPLRERGGLDTVLGERGMTLSGGQRQRLALARMLLADAPLLLLDEPTSAVDSMNEQLILDALATASRGRSVVVIAHRLSTVTDADQIIVLDEGRVVGRGTHHELMAGNEVYHELASRQLMQ